MRIAERVHEFSDAEAALARDDMGQQRVAGDVEGHTEENVGRTLIELARQLAVGDIELEQAMTGRQFHALDVRHVPGRDDEPARIRVALDLADEPGDLIVGLAVGTGPRAPLLAIDRAEIAIGVGPFIPDGNAIGFEIADVGIAVQEPDQFMHDRFQMQTLGGDERKPGAQIEPDLPAEQRAHASSGAVAFSDAAFQRFTEEIEIGAHEALRRVESLF